jgi:stalled ribosome rescue protein Dom34
MLNQLLETTPGVRTYENITVPEDVIRTMPEDQRRMYLLYKIIQADAAKRARERKKQEAALDPLQVLGVVNQL